MQEGVTKVFDEFLEFSTFREMWEYREKFWYWRFQKKAMFA